MASGPQRFSGCCLLGFTSPGRGRPGPCASAQPGQEELVADVSLCANPWLLASGAFYPPSATSRRKPRAWQGPETLLLWARAM